MKLEENKRKTENLFLRKIYIYIQLFNNGNLYCVNPTH